MIRDALPDDAAAIAAIYNHYIEHTVVTFEEATIPPAEVQRRIDARQAMGLPWLVAAPEVGRKGRSKTSARGKRPEL